MKNWLKRIAMGIGGVVVAAMLLAVAAPKAVHAIVSTLVTIANTPSNPVPTLSVDNPAKTPFFATATWKDANSDQCLAEHFLAIPPGMTAVVQDVSGYCRVQDNEGALGIPIDTSIFSHNGGGIDLSMIPLGPMAGVCSSITSVAPSLSTCRARRCSPHAELRLHHVVRRRLQRLGEWLLRRQRSVAQQAYGVGRRGPAQSTFTPRESRFLELFWNKQGESAWLHPQVNHHGPRQHRPRGAVFSLYGHRENINCPPRRRTRSKCNVNETARRAFADFSSCLFRGSTLIS